MMRSAKLEIQIVLQQHRDRDHRRQIGQRDVQEALPGRGTIDRGRFVHLARDRLQCCQQRDGEERHAEPDIGGNRPPHGEIGVAQDVVGLLQEAQAEEPVRDRADHRVQQPGEGQAREKCGDGPGQEDHRLDEPLAPKRTVEQQGEAEPEQELQHHRAEGPPGRVDQCPAKHAYPTSAASRNAPCRPSRRRTGRGCECPETRR